ncbi:NDR1/HIN1-like protein 10 [Malania oleifera]|uniref:NDR1/HIN1-like protein 10 n=1 Tax=Malania oleifera TaxID=397392 RepID=UPI0025AEBC0F|nr:NDR1/HIN1-like protein 10 [Malania oleifera]
MADKVHPSAKPKPIQGGGGQTQNGTISPSFPAPKSQLYGATRPNYHPRPEPRRSRRSCCCRCCIWLTVFIVFLIVILAVLGLLFWLFFRPAVPTFSVSTFRTSQFNITSSSKLAAKFNLTVNARNPNKKLVFYYDPIAISIKSKGVSVGVGAFPAFVHETKNTTVLKATISSGGQTLDDASAGSLKSDLKSKNGLPLEVQLDTKVRVKVVGVKTRKVPIRVSCDGIRATVPTGKSSAAKTSHVNCKVDFRIKIWKWTF